MINTIVSDINFYFKKLQQIQNTEDGVDNDLKYNYVEPYTQFDESDIIYI